MPQRNFTQDLSQKDMPGAVFIIKLLFKQPTPQPDQETMLNSLRKHVGEVECFWHDAKGAGFSALQYTAHFKDADLPPQLMITSGQPFSGNTVDDFTRSQMWDCQQERDTILNDCQYQIIATDMMAAVLEPQERANLDMDFLMALLDMFPDCLAVYFFNSGKMFLADDIRSQQINGIDRFIKFAVNARFFTIQGSEDMLVDTLGMSTLFLPDLQYHFRGMNPNQVVNHAYCIDSYILDNYNPIKSGDTIDAIVNGQFSQSVQWRCQYENALIQPAREVIDIYMNEYAAGQRD